MILCTTLATDVASSLKGTFLCAPFRLLRYLSLNMECSISIFSSSFLTASALATNEAWSVTPEIPRPSAYFLISSLNQNCSSLNVSRPSFSFFVQQSRQFSQRSVGTSSPPIWINSAGKISETSLIIFLQDNYILSSALSAFYNE